MVLRLAEFPTAEPFLPERITLPALKKRVQECRGCPLYKNATQAVFGEGPQHASIMFVGEQPGGQDLFGKDLRITKDRGKIFEDTGIAPIVMATVHPSSILRAPDHDAREKARREFTEDLAKAAKRLKTHH